MHASLESMAIQHFVGYATHTRGVASSPALLWRMWESQYSFTKEPAARFVKTCEWFALMPVCMADTAPVGLPDNFCAYVFMAIYSIHLKLDHGENRLLWRESEECRSDWEHSKGIIHSWCSGLEESMVNNLSDYERKFISSEDHWGKDGSFFGQFPMQPICQRHFPQK